MFTDQILNSFFDPNSIEKFAKAGIFQARKENVNWDFAQLASRAFINLFPSRFEIFFFVNDVFENIVGNLKTELFIFDKMSSRSRVMLN